MQRLFHVPAGASQATEIEPDQIDAARGDGWVWLDVVGASDSEVVDIARRFRFDPFAVEEVLRDTKYAKVEGYGDHTFVVGHAISGVGDRLHVTEYDAFIGRDYLVTFTRENLPGFEWGRSHITSIGTVGEAGPDRIFSRIAEAGAARFQPVLEALDGRIVALEESAILGHPEVPVEVQALRRDVIELRAAAAPQRDAYKVLEREDLPAIGDRARLRLGSTYDLYSRITDQTEAARSLLAGVLDTYRSAVAERANEVMKVLTVFAAIVLPLSLMAGVYGMNFANMPELAWRWGYFTLLGLMVLTALGLWVYFARRGFIGGPKLGAIPRGVGRGLLGIASLTVVPTLRFIGLGRDIGSEEQ